MRFAVTAVALAAPLRNGAAPPFLPQDSGDVFVITSPDRATMSVQKVPAVPASYVAYAHYTDAVATTGWGYLHVASNPDADDAEAAYAAGFIEGVTTAEQVQNFWEASMADTSPYDHNTMEFLGRGEAWIRGQVYAHNATDPYWYMVGLVYVQVEGLVAGFNSVRRPEWVTLTAWDVMKSNFDEGDVYDIQCLVNVSSCATSHPSFVERRLGRKESFGRKDGFRNRVTDKAARGHCTAALRVAPENADIFLGHTTWDDLENMYRIWKVYDLPFRATHGATSGPRATSVAMSSYPLSLCSSDDFVFNGRGLAAVSSEIFPPCPNADVWKGLTSEGIVWEFVRNVVAMRLATSAPNWAEIYGKDQSSTYNNEWLVVDYQKFTPGQPLPKDTIWLVDQMPGLFTAYDLTANVTQEHGGWFGSWNTQADPIQYNKCGWPDYIAQTAKEDDLEVAMDYSWNNQTRAKMFARDAPKVKTIEDFANLMRYNDYENDPLSKCDDCTAQTHTPCKAISTRCDLAPVDGMGPGSFWGGACFGGYDSKVLDASLIKRMSAWAQSGPTHDNLPPFAFSAAPTCKGLKTRGLPDLWNFSWVETRGFARAEPAPSLVV